MGLFRNYNDTGSGVAKRGPQKKPFFRFWEIFANKFWTLLYINFIYLLFCLPVVTFGPATAAATTLLRNIYLEKPQFVFHDFWQAFKKNFKQSLIIGIVDVIVIALTFYAFYFYSTNMDTQDNYWLYYALTMAAEVIFLLMNFYIYPQIVALDLKMSSIIKNSLILAFVNLKGNLIALALFIIYYMLVLFFDVFVLIFAPILPFGWLGFVAVFCCYPAIQKFIINPFYEAKGETNPELPVYDDDEEAVFEDRGGEEAPIKMKKEKKQGKIIR